MYCKCIYVNEHRNPRIIYITDLICDSLIYVTLNMPINTIKLDDFDIANFFFFFCKQSFQFGYRIGMCVGRDDIGACCYYYYCRFVFVLLRLLMFGTKFNIAIYICIIYLAKTN